MSNMYFCNQMFNQTYVNPSYYYQNQQRVQQYQLDQSYEVAKAVDAVRDLCKAVKSLDAQHQEQAFYLCLAEMANELGWKHEV